MYEFKTDDLFYDIESLENIFTCSHWYPAQNRLDVFYKMDITPDGPEKEIIENLTEEKVRERVLLRNPNVREKNITVNLKDLDDPQAITDFIKVYGISLKQNESPKLEDEDVIEGKNGTITWITDVGTGLKLALPYPIKETDEHLNPESRPNTGYRFGYNSYNYDMSMLAIYFELLIITDQGIVDVLKAKYQCVFILINKKQPVVIRFHERYRILCGFRQFDSFTVRGFFLAEQFSKQLRKYRSHPCQILLSCWNMVGGH